MRIYGMKVNQLTEPVGYQLIKKMFEENRLGKKTGHGFYDYE